MENIVPNIHVPTELLPDTRKHIHMIKPKAQIRRFIVDCHNGIKYSNNEFNYITLEDDVSTDEDAMVYLRKETYKHMKSKIYSCVELLGEIRLVDLPLMSNEQMKKHTKLIFYNPAWEPLSAYSRML